MGCCSSRPEDPENASPYPPVAAQVPDSSRNITAASPPQPASIASPRGSHASQSLAHPSRSRSNANDPPNTPLKRIPLNQRSTLPITLSSPIASTSRRIHPSGNSSTYHWTRSRLEKERNDWWDTQVTGSADVWAAIRLATQYLQAGGLEQSQTMLDASGCTCPSGLLWKGVYDSTGVLYRVPEWLVVEPDGLVNETEEEPSSEPAIEGTGVDGAQESEVLGDAVKIRVRLSSTGQDVKISIRKGEKVSSIVDKIKKKAGINSLVSVRLVFGGRIYQDNWDLESHPWWYYDSGHVLSAMVFE